MSPLPPDRRDSFGCDREALFVAPRFCIRPCNTRLAGHDAAVAPSPIAVANRLMRAEQSIPMATAIPVEIPMATAAPMAPNATPTPQHKATRMDSSTKCVLCLILCGVVFGGFLFVRMVIQPCGCPAGEELTDARGYTDGNCPCEGGVFMCNYQCGARCYSGGEKVSCDDAGYDTPDSEGSSNPDDEGSSNAADPPGSVRCPDASSYCSCKDDCDNDKDPYADNDYCECAEAKASTCCGGR